MPAPAVIPAPIAYIKVVAVKKLVVGLWARPGWQSVEMTCAAAARLFFPLWSGAIQLVPGAAWNHLL